MAETGSILLAIDNENIHPIIHDDFYYIEQSLHGCRRRTTEENDRKGDARTTETNGKGTSRNTPDKETPRAEADDGSTHAAHAANAQHDDG